jgi:mannose-6-phosphate isomerase-like protein (cupin superfamily)
MKFTRLVLVSLATAALLSGGGPEPAVTHIGHEKVAAALANSGTLVRASDYLVMGLHRSGPGHVELHEKETDVFYIVEGEATFVTGGKLVGSKVTSPGQRIGTDIQGGEAHRLSKGDVMVIPAGIPHWFKEVPHSISYFVVKVVKP